MEFPNLDVLQERVVELKIPAEAANFRIWQEYPDVDEEDGQFQKVELATVHPEKKIQKSQKAEGSDYFRKSIYNVLNKNEQQRALSQHKDAASSQILE